MVKTPNNFIKFSEMYNYTYTHTMCRFGAALTVETLDSPVTLVRLLYNPLCFLLYEDLWTAPDQWEDVSGRCRRQTNIMKAFQQSLCLSRALGGHLF